jgi:hypothetical protein
VSVPGLSDAEAWARIQRDDDAGFRLLAEALGAQLAEHEPTAPGACHARVAAAPTGKQPSCSVIVLDDYRKEQS